MSFASRSHALFQQRIITPVIHLLRSGASPRRLAWSLALGIAVGINPLLGSTTVLCLLLAFVFRLNIIASQISNHLVYPLQLALFFVFIRMGDVVFHTARLPLDREQILHGIRVHPWLTTQRLWSWEWHALLVWLLFSCALVPTLAAVMRVPLEKLLHRLHSESTA